MSSSLRKLVRRLGRPVVCVVSLFLVSRLVFLWIGMRFDLEPLNRYCQYLDPGLLQNDLLESLYYLHMQPPLFNCYLGIMLKLFQTHTAAAFHVSYLVLGLTLTVSMFRLMIRLGVPAGFGVVLTVLFMLSPGCILYENWLCYTYPTATLLCLSALLLHRYLSHRARREGIAFFTLVAIIVLTRSVFHILWFLLIFPLLLVFKHRNWRRLVAIGCIPFAAVFLLHAKNLCVFGSFTSSTWFGMNLSKITTFQLSREERETRVDEGTLSEFSLIRPFSGLVIDRPVVENWAETGISALDQRRKDSGYYNSNHIAMTHISGRYLEDALHVLASHPSAYLQGMRKSWGIYFRPSTDYRYLSEANRTRVAILERVYGLLFYGQLTDRGKPAQRGRAPAGDSRTSRGAAVFLIIGLPLLVVCGLYLVREELSTGHKDFPFVVTMLFLCGNIVYVALAVNSLEVGENNRFRFMIDPLYMVLLGVVLTSGLRRLRRYRAPD